MSKVRIYFPGMPHKEDKSELISELGRLAMAWSSSEYAIAIILARLMATPDLSTAQNVELAKKGAAVFTLDSTTVFSIFFAVESSRGRRLLVDQVAENKYNERKLTKDSFDRIKHLLNEHQKIGNVRNKYMHTAMGWSEGGHYVLMDKKMMQPSKDGTIHEHDAILRSKANRVDVKMVKDVGDRLDAWLKNAHKLMNEIRTPI